MVMLQAAVTPRRRPWRFVALLGLALAAFVGFLVAAFVCAEPDSDDKAVVPVVPVPPQLWNRPPQSVRV